MGLDEDNDDGLGGRMRTRREVAAANQWAERLCALEPAELDACPVPDIVRAAVTEWRGLPTPAARNRQVKRIDKLMRALAEAEAEAVSAWLANPGPHPLDVWCDRLLTEGDPAVTAWVELHPDMDRQRLRNLVRNAAASPAKRAALRAALAG